jgi:alkylation response protein AidB-like acyl-CoA dehydrogenase
VDFQLTEEQRIALDGWRRFLERDIRPVADRYRDSLVPKEEACRLLGMLGPYGVGCGWVPAEEGGAGLDFVSSGLLYEELARVAPDLAGIAFVNEGAAVKLHHAASPALKARYLPRLLAGDIIGCSAISEPGAGSYVRGMGTRAVRTGGAFRIRGEKMWISNSSICDIVILVAATGDQEYTMFLLDRAEHRFETREIEKLGLNGWSLGQIVLDDVLVPEENVVGEIGRGLGETMRGFERSRCFISLVALGCARAALDASIAYARDRRTFGKAIGAHQLVQALIAEMATELDAARLLVYRALQLVDRGVRCDVEAAMAKAFATEAAVRITSNAIQVHGAFGIAREFPVERHFRNARMLTIPDGTTQINQLIIGRRLLGLSAFGDEPGQS